MAVCRVEWRERSRRLGCLNCVPTGCLSNHHELRSSPALRRSSVIVYFFVRPAPGAAHCGPYCIALDTTSCTIRQRESSSFKPFA